MRLRESVLLFLGSIVFRTYEIWIVNIRGRMGFRSHRGFLITISTRLSCLDPRLRGRDPQAVEDVLLGVVVRERYRGRRNAFLERQKPQGEVLSRKRRHLRPQG